MAATLLAKLLMWLQAVSAVPLDPVDKWVVDYSSGMCVISRRYGGRAEPIDLGFRPIPMQPGGDLVVMTTGAGRSARRGTGSWLVDDGAVTSADYTSYPLPDGKHRLVTLAIDSDLRIALRDAKALTVNVDHQLFSFRLQAVASAMKALAACEDDLLARWGLDPAALRALAVLPRFAKNSPAAWFGPQAYPTAALRVHAQGKVIAVLSIGPSGKVSGCRLAQSSGNTDLDHATCAILGRPSNTVEPARDRSGQSVAADLAVPVNWVLPNG